MSKILYAASTYSHIRSFHLEYIEALRAMGHEVLTMANGREADFNIPFEKKIFSKKNTACRKEIAKIIAKEDFDAILVNTTLAAFHIRLALKGKKRPRVINFVHGYLFSKNSSLPKRLAFLACEKLLSRKTDAVIVMNGEDLEIAKKNQLSKGEVYMTRGMGVKPSVPKKSREEMRTELSINESFVMTFVGELSKRKNQEFLIRALKIIRTEIPNASLVLVGDGDERDALAELTDELELSNAVKFLGRRSDVADILCSSDLYVSAAKSEGLPFNIAEALSLGLTVIASDVKGHNDILKENNAGILYTPDNPSEFKDLVVAFKNGKLKPSAQSISEAFKKFSFEEVFSTTLKTVTEALNL